MVLEKWPVQENEGRKMVLIRSTGFRQYVYSYNIETSSVIIQEKHSKFEKD